MRKMKYPKIFKNLIRLDFVSGLEQMVWNKKKFRIIQIFLPGVTEWITSLLRVEIQDS